MELGSRMVASRPMRCSSGSRKATGPSASKGSESSGCLVRSWAGTGIRTSRSWTRSTTAPERSSQDKTKGLWTREEVDEIVKDLERNPPPPFKEQESHGYFAPTADGKGWKFSAPGFGKALHAETPFATDPGARGNIWVYREGLYQPSGEEYINLRVTGLLDEAWTPMHSSQTVAWLRQTSPRLNLEPPNDIAIVRNGIVRVTTDALELEEGDHPELLTPVRLAVSYDPSAECPKFLDFLKSCQPDTDLRKIVQEMLHSWSLT